MLYVNSRISIPLRELQFTYSRSSGPGGQNVNKVNTKATMHWDVKKTDSLPDAVRRRFMAKYARRLTNEGVLVLSSQRFRDQGQNVADCMHKLREMILAVAVAPKPRRATKPTAGSKRRRLADKKKQSEKKQMRRRPMND